MKRICLLFVILLFPITTFSHISEIKSIRDNFARFSNTSSSAVENYKYFASNYRSTDIRENLAEKPFSGMVSDEFLAAPPTITTSVTTLAAFTSCIQTTSESQDFTISGNFLTSGIVVTATVGFEVSMDNSAFSSSVLFAETGGIVPTSIVYVRMSPTTSAVSGTISLTSAAAVTQTVSVSGAVGATTTWNGTSWNPIAPNSTMMAVISGNYSQSADINACYLTVTNGAVVSIPSGYIVTLSGALTVESGTSFTLQNNAGLIQSGTTNPNSGDITVKRNSSFIKRMDYTLWSSPTFGPQSLQAFAIGTLPARFYTYKTSTNLYSTVLSPSTTNFATAKGYRIRTSNAHSITGAIWTGAFLGRPNSGDITVEMENDGPTFAFNCVGNPYPSPINATTFVQANSANITGTLYFWRVSNDQPPGNSYSSWSTAGFVTNGDPQSVDPNGIIQTGQGFIVEAKNAATSFIFNNEMRSATNVDQFFKTTTAVEFNRIWLNATSAEGLFSQTLIAYFTNGSDDLDSSDGKGLNDGAISLTSLIETDAYTIQGKSLPFNSSDVVALQFKATNAGMYQIAIDHVDGLFEGAQNIFLRDAQTGIDYNLKSGAYSFTSQAGTFANRFSVIYQNALSVKNPVFDSNSVILYKKGDNFIVNSSSVMLDLVEVYDLRGRVLAVAKNINANEVSINVGETNQILIVKITLVDGTTITKKTVN